MSAGEPMPICSAEPVGLPEPYVSLNLEEIPISRCPFCGQHKLARHRKRASVPPEHPVRWLGNAGNGRFPGLRVSACALPSQFPSGFSEQSLSAYSCGGSQGFGEEPNLVPYCFPVMGTIAGTDYNRSSSAIDAEFTQSKN